MPSTYGFAPKSLGSSMASPPSRFPLPPSPPPIGWWLGPDLGQGLSQRELRGFCSTTQPASTTAGSDPSSVQRAGDTVLERLCRWVALIEDSYSDVPPEQASPTPLSPLAVSHNPRGSEVELHATGLGLHFGAHRETGPSTLTWCLPPATRLKPGTAPPPFGVETGRCLFDLPMTAALTG